MLSMQGNALNVCWVYPTCQTQCDIWKRWIWWKKKLISIHSNWNAKNFIFHWNCIESCVRGFHRYIETGTKKCEICDVELSCNDEWRFVKVLTHSSEWFFIRIQFDKKKMIWNEEKLMRMITSIISTLIL